MDEEHFGNSSLCWWTKLLGLISLLVVVTICRTNKFLRFYSNFVILAVYLFVTAVIVIPFFFVNPRDVKNGLYYSYVMRQVTKLLGVTVELRNCEIVAQECGGVVVANHRNNIDILGLFHIWGVLKKAAIISKREVFYMWPFGLALWLCGTVFLDRVNSSQAKEQLNEASRMMRNDKVKLMIFPEGTRNRTDSPLLPFKKGAFRIAIASQVPIFPVVYSPHYFIDDANRVFNSGTMIMKALPPIETAGLTMDGIDDLIEKTREVMLETIKELTEEAVLLKRKRPS